MIIYINNILILSGILLAIFSQNNVSAAQPVIFKSVQEQSTPTTLLDFVSEIEGFSDTDIVIAKDDLNNDHIYEYIIRNTRCTPAEGCPYLIIADSDENYVVIGEFSGKI